MSRPGPPFGGLSARRFLERHWQREPLLVRGALPEAIGIVDGDTLAGLACTEGVESRIVTHERAANRWDCEDGPFREDRFASLPRGDWTLLVQTVELWCPEIASQVMSRFDFIPRWRLDDAMVSYAVDGGGVGPHFDYYDVFLVQVAGSRRWRVGQRCDEGTALRTGAPLKLLERFEPVDEHLLGPGDMLYLPPGVAHEGEAVGDDCITCSVGFRAPSHGEILRAAAERLGEALPAHRRYCDPVGDPVGDPAGDPYRIDGGVLSHLSGLRAALDPAVFDEALAWAFGHLVTLPRAPDLVDAPERAAVRRAGALIASGSPLGVSLHAASRAAYLERGAGAVLFVDGESHPASLAFARAFCDGSLDAAALAGRGDRAVLLALVAEGSVEIEP